MGARVAAAAWLLALGAAPLALGLAPLALAREAAAQEAGNPAQGRELAQQWCADCHRIQPGDLGESLMGAPAFADRAADPEITSLYLRAFFRSPHANMPDIRLSPDQTDDLVAYILSLKTR
jgi:mono/diheme cytochrome c family protein